MKMKKEHYQQLRAIIQAAPHHRFHRAYSDKRNRWDLLWRLPLGARQDWFSDNCIYDYLEDTHIDTALKQIVRELYK